MAQVPVEVLAAGQVDLGLLEKAITSANTLQDEFRYTILRSEDVPEFQAHTYARAKAEDILDALVDIRGRTHGYHPYWIAFLDSHLDGVDYGNIFGSDRPKAGLAVFTVANVPDLILPANRLAAYFLYYLAKASMSFMAPGHKNHEDTRACPYDQKLKKTDIVQSMRARSLCDDCRRTLLRRPTLSPSQVIALEKLFAACGDILRDEGTSQVVDPRPKVFVGSSTEGLPVAIALKTMLAEDLDIEVWNEGTVFGLGDATLEALERAVVAYDFGLFVFTPDDKLLVRSARLPVARDNVLFELGLFVGKLTRRRAFVVRAGGTLSLASDLAGITTATFSQAESDLAKALSSAVSAIRRAVQKSLAGEFDTVPSNGRLQPSAPGRPVRRRG